MTVVLVVSVGDGALVLSPQLEIPETLYWWSRAMVAWNLGARTWTDGDASAGVEVRGAGLMVSSREARMAIVGFYEKLLLG